MRVNWQNMPLLYFLVLTGIDSQERRQFDHIWSHVWYISGAWPSVCMTGVSSCTLNDDDEPEHGHLVNIWFWDLTITSLIYVCCNVNFPSRFIYINHGKVLERVLEIRVHTASYMFVQGWHCFLAAAHKAAITTVYPIWWYPHIPPTRAAESHYARACPNHRPVIGGLL